MIFPRFHTTKTLRDGLQRVTLLWLLVLFVPRLPMEAASVSPALPRAAAAAPGSNARPPKTDMELRSWLQNMVLYHHFTLAETEAALGMDADDIVAAIKAFRISPGNKPYRDETDPLLVLPYPGGRHPRIGFLEGEIDPQRETKLSVFTPWDDSSYVVIDVPEAVWSNLGLTYLAHTHLPTLWTKAGIELPKLEWRRSRDGSFHIERKLPNGILLATTATPTTNSLRLEIKLTNGTTNTLTDLRVQMCAMLKGATDFNQQTNSNKIFGKPFVACKSDDGQRWIIWAWEPSDRAWGNPLVPCMHSDPKFPNCKPGQTKTVHGWFSFYQGTDIQSELRRIEQDPWLLNIAATAE